MLLYRPIRSDIDQAVIYPFYIQGQSAHEVRPAFQRAHTWHGHIRSERHQCYRSLTPPSVPRVQQDGLDVDNLDKLGGWPLGYYLKGIYCQIKNRAVTSGTVLLSWCCRKSLAPHATAFGGLQDGNLENNLSIFFSLWRCFLWNGFSKLLIQTFRSFQL